VKDLKIRKMILVPTPLSLYIPAAFSEDNSFAVEYKFNPVNIGAQ
jgi:hypothetical protein